MQNVKTREQQIISAAIPLLLDDRKASLESIAHAAGVRRITVHRYFGGREQLIAAVQLYLIQQLDEIVQQAKIDYDDPLEQLHSIIFESVDPQNGFHLMFEGCDSNTAETGDSCPCIGVRQAVFEIIEQLKISGAIAPIYPVSWVFHMFVGVLFIAFEAYKRGAATKQQIPDLAWQSFIGGVLVNKNKI